MPRKREPRRALERARLLALKELEAVTKSLVKQAKAGKVSAAKLLIGFAESLPEEPKQDTAGQHWIRQLFHEIEGPQYEDHHD